MERSESGNLFFFDFNPKSIHPHRQQFPGMPMMICIAISIKARERKCTDCFSAKPKIYILNKSSYLLFSEVNQDTLCLASLATQILDLEMITDTIVKLYRVKTKTYTHQVTSKNWCNSGNTISKPLWFVSTAVTKNRTPLWWQGNCEIDVRRRACCPYLCVLLLTKEKIQPIFQRSTGGDANSDLSVQKVRHCGNSTNGNCKWKFQALDFMPADFSSYFRRSLTFLKQ